MRQVAQAGSEALRDILKQETCVKLSMVGAAVVCVASAGWRLVGTGVQWPAALLPRSQHHPCASHLAMVPVDAHKQCSASYHAAITHAASSTPLPAPTWTWCHQQCMHKAIKSEPAVWQQCASTHLDMVPVKEYLHQQCSTSRQHNSACCHQIMLPAVHHPLTWPWCL